MATPYSLTRPVSPPTTVRTVRRSGGRVDVYVLDASREVRVFRFDEQRLRDPTFNAADELDVTPPLYRLAGGACTCPGFEYRSECRHVSQVREWGWWRARP